MTKFKFKVGDIVTLNKIENGFGEDRSKNYDLPMQVRIRSIEGDIYDYGVETLDGEWLSSVYEKNLQGSSVVKQTQIRVSDGNISVAHTTNSKKNRVSFTGFGQAGHIKFDNIDRIIALLTKLKQEV